MARIAALILLAGCAGRGDDSDRLRDSGSPRSEAARGGGASSTEAPPSHPPTDAAPPPAPTPALPLPGRTIDLQHAVSSAAMIVEAELVEGGTPNPEAPGQSLFVGARARVTQTLRGEPRAEVAFSYFVQRMPETIAESVPEVGVRYILVLASGRDGYRAIKIVSATADDLAAVRSAIGP